MLQCVLTAYKLRLAPASSCAHTEHVRIDQLGGRRRGKFMRPPRTQQHTARVRTEGEAILDSPPLAAHTVAPGSLRCTSRRGRSCLQQPSTRQGAHAKTTPLRRLSKHERN